MNVDRLAKDFSREPVPEGARCGLHSLAAVWGATFLCIPVLTIAFQITPGLTFPELVFYAFAAGLFVAALACLTGSVGAATHLSSGMIFRTTFGRKGAIIPCLAIAISTLGWFDLQTEVFGGGLQNLLNLMFGWDFPVWGCIVFGAVLMSITGAIGFKALMFLSYLTIPLMLYVLGRPLFEVIRDGNMGAFLGYEPEEKISAAQVITLAAGGIFGGVIANPDFSRYMRSQKHMIAGTAANFLFLYPLMLIVGGVLAIMTGQSDFIQMMLALNMGVAAMIFLVLGSWTTNDTNVYGTSLPLAAIINVKKWQIALAAALSGTILGLIGILGNFVPFLILLGLLLAPLGGVYVADFFLSRDKYLNGENEKDWKLLPFAAWIAGGLTGLVTTASEAGGFGLFTLSTIPPFDGLVAAALVQVVLVKFLSHKPL